MKQKSISVIFVGVIAAFVLIACGDSAPETEATVTEASVTEQNTTDTPEQTTSSVHSIADSAVVLFDEEGNMINSAVEPTEEPAEQEEIIFLGTVVAIEGKRTTEEPLFTPVALRIGQRIASPTMTGGLTILFAEVLEDSRCPVGAECPTKGKAVIRTESWSNVTELGEIILALEEGQAAPTVKKITRYSAVLISLEPHPVEGETIGPSEYVAVIAVIK